MKRTEAKDVGTIIKDYLKRENLDGKVDEQTLVARWNEVVGPVVNRYTISRYIKDHVMVVQLSSAPLRNELMMHKTRLIDSLNALVGKKIIDDIIIR